MTAAQRNFTAVNLFGGCIHCKALMQIKDVLKADLVAPNVVLLTCPHCQGSNGSISLAEALPAQTSMVILDRAAA